jgi:aromatic ring-opening dioxygenase catalytic subunit (LigB family)
MPGRAVSKAGGRGHSAGMSDSGRENASGKLTRREAIVAGLATAGAAMVAGGAVGCEKPARGPGGQAESEAEGEPERQARASSATRLPVVYLPHGGGPWPWMKGFMPSGEYDALHGYLQSVAQLPKQPPRALVVVSAHWEEAVPTVMTAAAPELLYDYYGFPDETYAIKWPAPGAPQVAARVRELLGAAKIESGADARRGFDHGTFVPLALTYPGAEIPTVQLSLQAGLDPARHLAIGRALAPLRDEGVFLIGSGMSYHNLRSFFAPGGGGGSAARQFDAWLQKAATAEPAERARLLAGWAKAPSARDAHPREEHLLPLMVIAGAAGDDVAKVGFSGQCFGKEISAFHYG